MDNIISLPTDLQSVIGAERIDFSVISKRNQPLKKSLVPIAFGTIWTAFTCIFVFAFLGPLFKGEDATFKVNGVPTTVSWDNFQPMLVPALFIGTFVLVGIGILTWGIYSILQKGGYFVGTANRLIRYRKGNITSYNWEQFSGNMEINNKNGDISMQLRTGKMVSNRNSPDIFVPDTVYISGAMDILDIEKICRKRIKENNPM
ncbi:MAG: hypothetical protein WKF85_10955 [Chitinophagaceae bacterium]